MGFQLGLDVGEDLKPLLARMKELGDSRQGGVTLLDLQELISFFKQRREHIEEMKDVYDQGILPIHIISKELNGSLLELFHYCLSENEKAPDPRNQFYLLARHGGRKVDFDLSERPQWRLNLDITAVLLAAHLDILSKVEDTFAPLRIPKTLVPCLLEMKRQTDASSTFTVANC